MQNYEKLELIGKGSFGVVHKIRRKSDGRTLVWKELDYGRMRDKEKQLVVSEVNLLRELRHQHILRYYDRIIDKANTKLYIIVEFCEGGDLRQLVKRCRSTATYIDEKSIWKYFAQILSALKVCHRHRQEGKLRPILHRDIKPANIFLDKEGKVKLGDFGLARELSSQSKFAYTNVGTPFYMSPEQTNSLRYDERSDIWAVGCVLYELAALRPPFTAANQLALAMKINNGKFDRIPTRYSEDLHRVIRWMLHTKLEKRPRVEDLEKLHQIQSVFAQKRAAAAPSAPSKTSTSTEASNANALTEKRLLAREKAIAERERAVTKKELALIAREKAIAARERALETREGVLRRREKRSSSITGKTENIARRHSAAPEAPSTRARAAMPPPSKGTTAAIHRDTWAMKDRINVRGVYHR